MRKYTERLYQAAGIVAAYCLIFPVWVAYLLGRVKIHWSPEAKAAWKNGGVLVIANHPSLIETIVLPALFWKPSWLGDQSRIPWSLADIKLFGNRPWIYHAFRCIAVSRDEEDPKAQQINIQAVRSTLSHLNRNGIVILYPERGRTCKGKHFWSNEKRRIRQIADIRLIQHVVKKGHFLLPAWIEHGIVTEPESFWQGYKKLFFGPKFEVCFGSPIASGGIEMEEFSIAQLMLNVGK